MIMILEQTLQGNYSFWGQILQRNYSYSQPTSWSWTQGNYSHGHSHDHGTNIARQLQFHGQTLKGNCCQNQLLSCSRDMHYNYSHPMSWSWDTNIIWQLVSQPIVMILGHTHYSQPMSQSWNTYYKAITVTYTLQGNYNQPMAWSWDTHYKAITVTYILQGNYSQPMSWSWDACIPRQLQS